MQHLKRIRKLVLSHRFRSQIETKVKLRFGSGTHEHVLLMQAIDEVSATHDKGRRHNGEFLKSHEFAMFIIALEYCKIRDLATLLAIILHDMHEDYLEIWPLLRIIGTYGQEVSDIVNSVTKPDKALCETQEAYDEAIFAKVRTGGVKALVVKCIDRLHNMLTLVGSPEKCERKVVQTARYVISIAAECNTLLFELMKATEEQMKRLKMQRQYI